MSMEKELVFLPEGIACAKKPKHPEAFQNCAQAYVPKYRYLNIGCLVGSYRCGWKGKPSEVLWVGGGGWGIKGSDLRWR